MRYDLSLLLLFSVSSGETAFNHWKRTHSLVNEMGSKHASSVGSLIRSVAYLKQTERQYVSDTNYQNSKILGMIAIV